MARPGLGHFSVRGHITNAIPPQACNVAFSERSQVSDKARCRGGCSVSHALTEACRQQITSNNGKIATKGDVSLCAQQSALFLVVYL